MKKRLPQRNHDAAGDAAGKSEHQNGAGQPDEKTQDFHDVKNALELVGKKLDKHQSEMDPDLYAQFKDWNARSLAYVNDKLAGK